MGSPKLCVKFKIKSTFSPNFGQSPHTVMHTYLKFKKINYNFSFNIMKKILILEFYSLKI